MKTSGNVTFVTSLIPSIERLHRRDLTGGTKSPAGLLFVGYG